MKRLSFLLLLVSFVACDPYGFGFKKNPAYVLDEAFKAVTNLDTESFLEVTAKEALCVYGNEKGLAYLKEKAILNVENVKIKPNVLTSKHHKVPVFVGYWSFYSERYQIDIEDKISKKNLMKTIVDCEYGTEDDKSEKWIGRNPKDYKKKECRLIKVVPYEFKALEIPKKCEPLKVKL